MIAKTAVDQLIYVVRQNMNFAVNGFDRRVDRLARIVEVQREEIAALRSVLSEWEQDKSCYTQFARANELSADAERIAMGIV